MSCRYSEEIHHEYGRTQRILTLENEALLVQALPWDGGRVTRLVDQISGYDHIWTNDRTRALLRTYAANYDDLSNSGIEEAFPTVGSCTWSEAILPFFGEVWSAPWEVNLLVANQDEIKVLLESYCSIYPARIAKTFTLKADFPELQVDYEIENIGAEEFSYVFGVHPSVRINPATLIELPASQYSINYLYPANFSSERAFTWPRFSGLDLRQAGRSDDKLCINFLSSDGSGGDYAFYESDKNSGLRISYDPELFQCLSIWLIYGGWRGHYCAMTEFFTSWPASLTEAVTAGLAKRLAKASKTSTSVIYSIFRK
jgi:hypothetical protein